MIWNPTPSHPAASSTKTDRLISEFADDPDMVELVAMFIDELPQRIAAMEAALASEDLAQLSALSHQLKGAAGGYGFTPITDLARVVEERVRQGEIGRAHV